MESASTPAQPLEEGLAFEQSIIGTPKPQASSTVNRRQRESLTSLEPNVVQSPYLSNLIDGMRRMTDQLDTLHAHSRDSRNMPPPSGHPLRKAASIAAFSDDRRESIMTESEANSSLGILKLDNIQGFSEFEDGDNVAEVLERFRQEYSFKSLLGKENINPDSNVESLPSVDKATSNSNRRYSDIQDSCKSVHLEPDTTKSRKSLQADLRLRLQRALAQRTIDRSVDSIRMSQLSDTFDIDNLSMSAKSEFGFENQSKDGMEFQTSSSQPISSPSLPSNATFGAANFLSFSGIPAVIDSLSTETFQPADMAMERLKEDENSWMKHFADLPAVPQASEMEIKTPLSDATHLPNVTQNLDFSTFSGKFAGDVSVSSSVLEDIGKRRLSVGEYFKLHSEQLDDKRPNFGNSIRSPPKRRPHPPLVNLSQVSGNGSLDEVPTRDTGLNLTLGSSFADTLNSSLTIDSEAVNHEMLSPAVKEPASRSVDLMPPPPAPPSKVVHGMSHGHISEKRDSLSSRLSMSLSIPRDTNESEIMELNSSSLSLDSGEKIASISQIMNAFEFSNAKKSNRQLVDEFLTKCRIPSQAYKTQSKDKILQDSKDFHQSSMTKTCTTSDNSEQRSKNSPEECNQRVKEWISTITNSSDVTIGNDSLEDVDKSQNFVKNGDGDGTYDIAYSLHSKRTVNVEINKKIVKMEGKSNRLSNAAYEGEESDTSFMPPPVNMGNPASKLRLYSTPKGPMKRSTSHEAISNQNGFSSIKPVESEAKGLSRKNPDRQSVNSQDSDKQSEKSLNSPHRRYRSNNSSGASSTTQKRGSHSSQSESNSGTLVSSWKHHSKGEPRPPSACGSLTSCAKSSSRHTDSASVGSSPLHIDTTHTQLSWPSVSPGSSATQTFTLRNRAAGRVRLLISSPNSAFKLIGERGEIFSEFPFTLHAEETRRIHVVFSPISVGDVVGKLVIRRVSTSENSAGTIEERRLIGLYGYGGKTDLSIEGASKDQWAQLFLNMNAADTDTHSEVSDVDSTGDAPEVVASFSVRNTGKVPAFVCLHIDPEIPFADCGVYVHPKEISLSPGEVGRVMVRFDPTRDILEWLSENAADMQLLANVWLSWSERATWQRIQRLYSKYYKSDTVGPLSSWGSLYSGELGVGRVLKDDRSAEASLARTVRRLKVAVLIERERLCLFDLDATMVFSQLIANETAMFNSPQLNDTNLDTSEQQDSPILAGMSNLSLKRRPALVNTVFSEENSSPLSSAQWKCKPARNLSKHDLNEAKNDFVIITNAPVQKAQAVSLEFPSTILHHKSKMKITVQNPFSDKSLVSTSDPTHPFSVSTTSFNLPPSSYITLSIFFRPSEAGTHHTTLNIYVNGNHTRSYFLKGEGVSD